QAGAEPHQRNVYGQTAVHLAAQRNHTSSVLVLLAAGVPTDVKDNKGFTPLMYVAKLCITNMDLTRVLINYGPSPVLDAKDSEEGNTVLHWAVVGGVMSPYALSPILKAGADLNARNKAGYTPEELAESLGNIGLSKYLKMCREIPFKAKDVPLLRGLLLPLLQVMWWFSMVGTLGCLWGCTAGLLGLGASSRLVHNIFSFDANWFPLGVALWSTLLIIGSDVWFLGGRQDGFRTAMCLVPGLLTLWFLYKSV
ncbi:unnamed protein product, partial [Discosporangium mesarthrocarpum]